MSDRQRSGSRGGSRGGTSFFMAKRIFNRGEEDSLRRSLSQLAWSEVGAASAADVVWDVWLSDAETGKHATPLPGQVLSRFPAMADCCRKAVFATIFSRLRRLLPADAPLNDGRFIPAQFSLPRQKDTLREHVEEAASASIRRGLPRPYYIVKPDVGSRGDGIKLTSEPERKSWAAGDERVVQEYIARPMLLDGLKFDLRLYVLVADVHEAPEDDAPMRLYLYREGLARFAVETYETPAADNVKNVHMHLTNYSLNRKAGNFKHCHDADGGDGSKRTVSSVFDRLHRNGRISDPEELWDEIAALVARSVGVIQPILAGSRGRWSNACFQVLGLDVLLDVNGHPWLIEVNDHPSLRVDVTLDEQRGGSMPSAVDETVKLPMLRDAMRVVSELHGLRTRDIDEEMHAAGGAAAVSSRAPAASRSRPPAKPCGAFGTAFVEVVSEPAETRHLKLLARLRDIFEMHSPSSSVFEATWGDATKEDAMATSSAGPKWKAATFSRFVQSAGLVGGHRASAVAAGLSRPDADQIFASVCGKGGSMDLLDFAEALSRVAARIFPAAAGEASPTELITRLLARHFNESHVSTPAATVVTCLGYGLQKDDRLAGCSADEACIASSAIRNPSKFAPPWAPNKLSPEASDTRRAWRALVSAVEDQRDLTVAERVDEKYYLRCTAPSAVPQDGIDDIEFRLLDELPPRALFRSATRQSIFVYPLQQPLPNQKSHAERLEQIRSRLGWEQLGLPGDGALESEMGGRQLRNFFGLQLQGVSVPEEYDD